MLPPKVNRKFELFFLSLLSIAIFVAGLWIFTPTLSYPFQFDDFSNVVFNRAIRHLGNPAVFWENITLRNRSFTAFTYALNYYWAGLSLSAFRSWNIGIHFANAFLLGGLFYQLFSQQGKLVKGRSGALGSILVAGIFLLHPLATDTTIYITGRASLLAVFFPLLALLIYFSSFPLIFRTFAFWGLMLLGILSKESAVVFFAMVGIFHLWRRRPLLELFAFLFPLLPGAIYFWSTKATYLRGAWSGYFYLQGDLSVRTFWEHLQVSVSLWPKILTLFFVPTLQSLDHDLRWDDVNAHWKNGALLWAVFFVVLFWNIKRPKTWQMPILWLFLSLLTTNSIFPTLDPLSERHFYVAIPWLAMAFVLWLPNSKRVLSFGGILLLVFLTIGAHGRAREWESSLKLWTSAHKLYPEKFRIRFNLARAMRRDGGDTVEAFRLYWDYLGKDGFLVAPYQRQMEVIRFLIAQWDRVSAEEKVKIEVKNSWHEIVWKGASLEKAKTIPEDWKRWKQSRATDLDERQKTIVSILEVKKLVRIPEGKRKALRILKEILDGQKKDHHPYWVEDEILGDLYLSEGKINEALFHFNRAARIFKVFKRFPRELHLKIYRIYWEQGDWIRASDALGELVRLLSDDVEVRALYVQALKKMESVNASSQAKHLSFYERQILQKEKEIIRP